MITLENCEDQFRRLATISTFDSSRKYLESIFAFQPRINFSIGRGSIYWRGRKCREPGFNESRELWHPPPKLTPINRLNDEGQPCLYLSGKIETVLSELNVVPGEHVHVAGYRVLADKMLELAAIGELSHVQKIGYPRVTGVDPGLTLAKILNGYPFEEALRILCVDSFFGDILSNAEAGQNQYIHTRSLAYLVRHRYKAMGLFYPSVKNQAGLNLAVWSSPAKEALHGVASIVVKVTRKLPYGFYDFDVIRTAIGESDSGEYNWCQPEHSKFITVYRMSELEYQMGLQGDRTLLNLPTHQALTPDRAGRMRRILRRLVG